MGGLTQAAAQAEANRLRGVARQHKRAVSVERKRARKAAQRFEDFVAECRRNGIIVYVESTAQPRRHSGNSSNAS